MTLKLPASARIKRRYLLIQGGGKSVIEKAIIAALGTFGWSRAAPLFVSVPRVSDVVLSIDRSALDEVRAALELAPEKLEVRRVSGTIKGLQK